MNSSFIRKPENMFALVCLVFSTLGFVFMGALVAKPKVLFGQSLTAITPSIFPSIILGLLALLCLAHLIIAKRNFVPSNEQGIIGIGRGAVFFSIMTVYGLVLVPLGFIISSSITIAVLSWYTGNRSKLQIALIAILAPIFLYLSATRLLAVYLPELDVIELAISRLLG
ncbi:tripartite tricarboxylate transporter TctB family protein [Planktotalea sp.]|uniref:tripartite tricarboxylate transporter TctB family protein n=1 Tax=Planktotalea sp. TaxID=2029877 RepID=UPI0032999F39